MIASLLEQGKPGVAVLHITPEVARSILEKNEENRKVSPTKAAQFASDMTEGRWAFNGESIVIADDGSLNDGQHRLVAVVTSGVAIDSVVAYGVPRETRFTVDQGLSRSAAAVYAMKGGAHSNEATKVARLAIAYERNQGKMLGRTGLVSTTAVLERAQTDTLVATAAAWSTTLDRSQLPATTSQVAFWRYLAKDDERKVQFVTAVAAGENIAREDAAYLVRTRMARESAADYVRTEIYLRGLNAFLAGESFKHIRLIGEFPQIKG